MSHAFNTSEIDQLEHTSGQTLYGDGALVVLKGLLESGVSYLGGYPGAPTANLIDAVADAYEPVLKKYGIYVESPPTKWPRPPCAGLPVRRRCAVP